MLNNKRKCVIHEISTNKFFKGNKIAQANTALVQFVLFKKINKCLSHQISRKSILLLFSKVHEKAIKGGKFLKKLWCCVSGRV